MSVTVADLLKLPSLRQAKVLGGAGGLGRIVSSISVLESTDPEILVDEVFPQNEYNGGEIVITGFLNCLDDVACQLANLRRLIDGGEAALVLYYVGVYLPRVDPRLVALADEKNFVLICMPEGRRELRYSDLITDVTECIYRDRARGASIVSDVLARVSELPENLRTVNTVLKILSEQLSASVVLCDGDFRILDLITWPRGLEDTMKDDAESLEVFPEDGTWLFCPFQPHSRLYRLTLDTGQQGRTELLLLKDGEPLGQADLDEAAEAVRLGVSIWGQKRGEAALRELVRAILQDEPIKVRRLAATLGVDIASIHTMWAARPRVEGESLPPAAAQTARELLESPGRALLSELYRGAAERDDLILFFDQPGGVAEVDALSATLLERLGQFCPGGVTLTTFHYLNTIAEVREGYDLWSRYEPDARILQPNKRVLRGEDLILARRCRELIRLGEESVRHARSILDALSSPRYPREYRDTLAAFLLDGQANVQKTADLLFVHKNTVQYRLHRMSDCFGFSVGEMPASLPLYLALGVERLLHGGQ